MLCRLSLFGPCSSSRIGISWFGCQSSLSLWAEPCFVTSSRTVDMSRSVCRTLLGMYHSEFTIVRNTLFWKRCSIAILDWEAMPHRGIPYVHIGRSNILYSRSLFSIDICECLPMIQYIRLNKSSNCFLLACMCVRHVSRRSKCNPRYFACLYI
jgi:hypothetical protein